MIPDSLNNSLPASTTPRIEEVSERLRETAQQNGNPRQRQPRRVISAIMKPTMKTAAIILATVVMSVAGVKLFDRFSSPSTPAQTGRFTQAEHKARDEAFHKKFSYYMRRMKEVREFEGKTRRLLYGERASGTVAILESDLADARKEYDECFRRWEIAMKGMMRSSHWFKHGTENGEYVERDDIDPESL